MKLLSFPKPELQLLVCVNSKNKDAVKPSCGPKIDMREYYRVRKGIYERFGKKRVKITKVQCFGICPQEGFIVQAQPSQDYYELTSLSELEQLAEKYLD